MQNQNLIKNTNDQDDEKSSFKLKQKVSAVLVATIIGFILDNWFGTKPWLIIVFFIGVATGIINVINQQKMQKD